MFPWYHGYQKYKELPEDDRLAIQQIYGSRQKIWGDNPRPRVTPNASSTTTSTTPRSYYPDRNPTDRDRQRERDERERQEKERDRERQRLEREQERERQRQEWERKEWERRASEREQREKERRRQKEREQREREEQERRRQQSAWERDERERNEHHRYDGQNVPTTTAKTWHHHSHHPKYNKNGQNHPKKEKPDTCNTSYDAITIIRNELFIFKDRVSFFWLVLFPLKPMNGIVRMPHGIHKSHFHRPENSDHFKRSHYTS